MQLITEQVKSEITKRLKERKQSLRGLGAKRQTPAEQYKYLIDISMKFQRVVLDALNTNYGRHKIFDDRPSLRLVTAAVNRSEAMAATFASDGHVYHFDSRSTNGTKSKDLANIVDSNFGDEFTMETTPPSAVNTDASGKSSKEQGTISVRQFPGSTVVDDHLPSTAEVAKSQRGWILGWLRRIYRESRGFEIGTVNANLLATIMRDQSRKWENIALGYVADVIVLTNTFVHDLLHEVCPVRRVRDGILELLAEQLHARYEAAIKHVEFLLAVELNGTPSTQNHYFNDNLQKWYV